MSGFATRPAAPRSLPAICWRLSARLRKVARELRTQYLITYKPTNTQYDGSYRRVDVKLTNGHENLKLRTKKGYKAVADSVTTK